MVFTALLLWLSWHSAVWQNNGTGVLVVLLPKSTVNYTTRYWYRQKWHHGAQH